MLRPSGARKSWGLLRTSKKDQSGWSTVYCKTKLRKFYLEPEKQSLGVILSLYPKAIRSP